MPGWSRWLWLVVALGVSGAADGPEVRLVEGPSGLTVVLAPPSTHPPIAPKKLDPEDFEGCQPVKGPLASLRKACLASERDGEVCLSYARAVVQHMEPGRRWYEALDLGLSTVHTDKRIPEKLVALKMLDCTYGGLMETVPTGEGHRMAAFMRAEIFRHAAETMRAQTPPPGLSPEQVVLLRSLLEEKAEVQAQKAATYYDEVLGDPDVEDGWTEAARRRRKALAGPSD